MWQLMERLPVLVWQHRPNSLPGAGRCYRCPSGMVAFESGCRAPHFKFQEFVHVSCVTHRYSACVKAG